MKYCVFDWEKYDTSVECLQNWFWIESFFSYSGILYKRWKIVFFYYRKKYARLLIFNYNRVLMTNYLIVKNVFSFSNSVFQNCINRSNVTSYNLIRSHQIRLRSEKKLSNQMSVLIDSTQDYFLPRNESEINDFFFMYLKHNILYYCTSLNSWRWRAVRTAR